MIRCAKSSFITKHNGSQARCEVILALSANTSASLVSNMPLAMSFPCAAQQGNQQRFDQLHLIKATVNMCELAQSTCDQPGHCFARSDWCGFVLRCDVPPMGLIAGAPPYASGFVWSSFAACRTWKTLWTQMRAASTGEADSGARSHSLTSWFISSS